MKIAIDLTSLFDNFSGIERFALSITKEIILNNNNEYILLFKNEIHKEFIDVPSNVSVAVLKGSNKLFFNQIILPLRLLSIRADKYLFLAFPAPFLFFNKNSISAIHDLGCWDCPQTNKKHMNWYFRMMYMKASLNNKKIITVSEFSKNRIIEILKTKPCNVQVICNGLSDVFLNFKNNEKLNDLCNKKYKLPEKYMLTLSTLEPRKNLKLLIQAFSDLVENEDFELDLVLAGRKGWMMDDLMENVSNKVSQKIHFTGFIDEEHLPYIYKKATVFIFPSIYEGFGIPPIEAMSMGTPVISSDAASLPEILGDAAIYFKNNSIVDLKVKIRSYVNLNEFDITNRKEFGKQKANQYLWKNEVLKIF